MKSMLFYSSLIMLFFFALATKVTAQTEADMMKAWQEYMTPGDMHKVLASYEGEWTTEGKMWMDPNGQPMTSTGSATYRMVLGGRYQETVFTGDMMGQQFEGKGLMGYDNFKKQFESTWVDNMGTGTMRTEGTYDPATKTFTMTGKMVDPMTRKECAIRETLKMVDQDTHVMTMYNSIAGAPEFKTMELTFKRKK
ncbi:MAG: DUF1579 domain-containing protein [Chitinophagaceae bacterium]|nr:DUF1579 domain-containing protein [Chitinophagaceae bacterium]